MRPSGDGNLIDAHLILRNVFRIAFNLRIVFRIAFDNASLLRSKCGGELLELQKVREDCTKPC